MGAGPPGTKIAVYRAKSPVETSFKVILPMRQEAPIEAPAKQWLSPAASGHRAVARWGNFFIGGASLVTSKRW
jgi:hypothetical protein